jgi:site-specific recombinase XerD
MLLHDIARGATPSHSYARRDTSIQLSSIWNASAEEYKDFLNAKNQSYDTVRTKLSRIKDFFAFLMQSEIFTPAELHPSAISDFIRRVAQTHKPIYRYNMLQSLKDFLSFLYSSSHISNNYALLLSPLPDPSDSVLPTTYSVEEIRAILSSVDRNTLMGKRDFAIIQIIAQTGIRAIDVANLKLEDICTEPCELRFLQHKTKRRLQLPMTDELKFSLYDYLRSRENYQCSYLFIRITDARAAIPVTSSCISAIIKKYIRQSGVYCPGRKAGAHSLRHSLAVSMTDAGTPFPIVSKALGHSSTEVTKKYAGISLNLLRKLALEVPLYER